MQKKPMNLSDLGRMFVNPGEGVHPEVGEFNDKLSSYFDQTPAFKAIDVTPLEKGMYDLSYNLSILSKKVGKTVIFYILVYAVTNKDHLTLIEYKELKERGVKNPILPSNALNKKAGEAIAHILKGKYGEDIELDSIDGNIVPATVDLKDDNVVVKYATLSGNFINARAAKIESGWSEKDFGRSLSTAKVVKGYPTVINANDRYDIDGVPQFVEYGINITAIDGDGSEEINREGKSVPLGQILGNVQFLAGASRKVAISTKADLKISKAMKANGKVIAHPVMVVNALNDAYITSLGTTLIALAAAGAATAQGRWKEIALANASVPGKNPGELEVIVNSQQLEVPKKLNLADESIPYEDRIDLLSSIVEGSPIFALDIMKFMSQTSHFTVLLRASKEAFGQGDPNKPYLKELIKGAHEFTNGVFPLNFPIHKIFGRKTITLPTGYFKDGRRGERSLDEIDTLMVLKKFGVKDAIMKMRLDNGLVEKGTNTVDLYLKLMGRVSPDIKITGVKERIYIHSAFVTELFKAIKTCGIPLELPAPEDIGGGISMPDISMFDDIGFGEDDFGFSDGGFGGADYGFGGSDFM